MNPREIIVLLLDRANNAKCVWSIFSDFSDFLLDHLQIFHRSTILFLRLTLGLKRGWESLPCTCLPSTRLIYASESLEQARPYTYLLTTGPQFLRRTGENQGERSGGGATPAYHVSTR